MRTEFCCVNLKGTFLQWKPTRCTNSQIYL